MGGLQSAPSVEIRYGSFHGLLAADMGRLIYMDRSPGFCPRDDWKWHLALQLKVGIVGIERLSEP